ncbi:hypothetical protein PIROE2DRAFT_14683 [Piromyces sp. E2]|nr:hypothetical protein PIROE2DRAFT_14683 [Piromyces sp. E2]|eukprot:OUM59712.1 hypothetical protein PIROE2DRAFT_14683 [Piromyces sp. E2]
MLLKFNLYNEEELEKHSVLISNKSELIDNTTSYILDPIMSCKQCKKYSECPGHLGRIKLKQRIVHSLFVNILCEEITHICPICKVYKISNDIKSICCSQKISATTFGLHKINYSNLNSHKNKSYRKMKSEYAFSFGKEWISINEMYNIIYNSDFSNDPNLKIKLLNIFIRNIPVLPINIRPSIVDSSNIVIHNNITSMYIRLLDLNSQYQNEMDNFNNSYALKIYNLFKKILGINSSTDVSENFDKAFIKQLLSGKTGIFRSMCLAKRQNFCLRSVIVPNIDTPLDRILIPKEFTDQLTPYGYKPNDFVIINRQPTLQTTSLLSVRSFPSTSRTIQINPLIASVFQADFDGDEMNIFWLPGKEAKKELLSNLNISNNIRSYKNSSLMIKFIQDTLTGLYNMTRDKNIADTYVVKRICNKLNIPNKKWNYFRKYYKSRMKSSDIPYSHLLSLLLPRTLTIKHKNKIIVDHGILLGVINGDNQTILFNSIINYGNEYYLKFMWDVQRMVHVYNLFHTITISVADCFPSDNMKNYSVSVLNNIPDDLSTLPISNLDTTIMNQNKPGNQSNIRENVFQNYYSLTKLVENLQSNLTNIVNSGSKGVIYTFKIGTSRNYINVLEYVIYGILAKGAC